MIFVFDGVSKGLDGSYYTWHEKYVNGDWTGAILDL